MYVAENQQLSLNRIDCNKKKRKLEHLTMRSDKTLYYVILEGVQSDILYMLNFISSSNYVPIPFDVSDLHFLIFALVILYQ